ncbi:hypothetical protein MHEL_33670 [Mycolicibacterium helvum]|uniref:Uncharacterized protein n=1 Tax=Mycolicibacterium helvum TaxID=1534349 RepID=A0A7I7T774_9MYCO|nr:hypothetical protein MHEL_33670 [Mycolicibacterium helvum]
MVFPLGISRAQRLWLRLWRAWPTWGVLLWVASEIYLSSIVSNWTAIGIATAVYAASGAGALAPVRGLRSQVRTLSVSVVDRRPDPRSGATCDELESLVHMLSEADALRACGELSDLDHEAVWRQVYDRLGPGRPEPLDHQPSI